MPAISKTIPQRPKEFWNSLDHANIQEVLEAVMDEYGITDQDHIHYSAGHSNITCGVPVMYPCFRDCQIFLLRGAFIIKGQGWVNETGYSYVIKDETWIELCRPETIIIIMEEGQQRGACRKATIAWQEKNLAEKSKPKGCLLM